MMYILRLSYHSTAASDYVYRNRNSKNPISQNPVMARVEESLQYNCASSEVAKRWCYQGVGAG